MRMYGRLLTFLSPSNSAKVTPTLTAVSFSARGAADSSCFDCLSCADAHRARIMTATAANVAVAVFILPPRAADRPLLPTFPCQRCQLQPGDFYGADLWEVVVLIDRGTPKCSRNPISLSEVRDKLRQRFPLVRRNQDLRLTIHVARDDLLVYQRRATTLRDPPASRSGDFQPWLNATCRNGRTTNGNRLFP